MEKDGNIINLPYHMTLFIDVKKKLRDESTPEEIIIRG